MKKVSTTIIDGIPYKECTKCHELKPLSDYYKHKDSLYTACIPCHKKVLAINAKKRGQDFKDHKKERLDKILNCYLTYLSKEPLELAGD